MPGTPISQQKILSAAYGDTASKIELFQALAQAVTQQQAVTGTTPVASPTPGQRNPAAPIPPQATGTVSFLSGNYIVQLVNSGGQSPISAIQAREAAGNATQFTPLKPTTSVYNQIRASTSPAFNVNSNTQVFGGDTGSQQTYWTLTGLGAGRWYFQFRSSYDGINFNQWKNIGGTTIGTTVAGVTVQGVTNGIFGSFNLPGGQLVSVGQAYVPNAGTFSLPQNLYSSAMLAIAGPNGFVDNGHTVSTISVCEVDVATPVVPEPIIGPADYPIVVSMQYEDNGGNMNVGNANVFALAFDPLGPNVKQVPVTGGNWVVFRMSGGWYLAIGQGKLASGSTIPLPAGYGFNVANMLAIPTPNGYFASGHQAGGIKNGSVTAGVVTMQYGDNSSNVWTSTADWFAVAWTPGIPTVSTTGGKWLIFQGADDSKFAFGAGVIASGASFALPAGFSSANLLSIATPNSFISTGNVMHGVLQCFIDVLTATLTYQDGSGNSWSGNVNWFGFCWEAP